MGLRYSPLKIFHYKEKIDSLPPDGDQILPPIHIRIKPTNVCAHNCSYCSYRLDGVQLGQDMKERDTIPKEKMLEIIDDLQEMGVKAVTFSGGGDPFYYPYLLETVKKLSSTNIRFSSLTNGARLEGELARFFSTRASWIRISIDGWDSKSYAAYRGVNEKEFDRVIGNIRAFSDLSGPCHLGAVVIVDRANAEHVYELSSMLKDTGIQSLKISPCVTNNDGEKSNEYHKSIFKLVKSQIEKISSELVDEDFDLFDSYHMLEEKFNKNYQWCPYLQILPIIGADLNVYSCQDKAYNLSCGVLGSISDKRFKDFWMADKKKFFTINPSKHCKHHCVSNTKNMLLIEHSEIDADHMGFV